METIQFSLSTSQAKTNKSIWLSKFVYKESHYTYTCWQDAWLCLSFLTHVHHVSIAQCKHGFLFYNVLIFLEKMEMICPNLFYFGWFFDFCKTDHLGVREEAIALPPMYKTHLENGKEILDFFFCYHILIYNGFSWKKKWQIYT